MEPNIENAWTNADLVSLREMARLNLSPHEIALRLSKSESEVLMKATELGIVLRDPWAGSSQQKNHS